MSAESYWVGKIWGWNRGKEEVREGTNHVKETLIDQLVQKTEFMKIWLKPDYQELLSTMSMQD